MDNKEDPRTSPKFAKSTGLCVTPQPYNGWGSPASNDWPSFELNNACTSTPLSSPVTPFTSSGNCLDDSFQTALPMNDKFNPTDDEFVAGTMAYQMDAPEAWNEQKEPQHRALSYFPELVFENNPTYGNFVQNHGIDSTVLRPPPLQPETPTKHPYEIRERTLEPQQGNRVNSTKRPSTRKTKDGTGRSRLVKKEQRLGSNGQPSSSRSSHQLRSTKNTPKVPNIKLKPTHPREAVNSQTPDNGRASHNFVEKQYRNRLNDQFNTLLSSIPNEVIKQEISGYVREDGPERRVSKAEVLVLAKKHIETLERDRQLLEEEREGLKGTVKRLKGALVHSGGGYCHEA